MKILYFVLIVCFGYISYADGGRIYKPEYVEVNMKEHGYDGRAVRDKKTGLLQPPPEFSRDTARPLTLYSEHKDLWCKTFDADEGWTRETGRKDLCHKTIETEEYTEELDLCCSGYTCTEYGVFVKGYYCKKNNRNG